MLPARDIAQAGEGPATPPNAWLDPLPTGPAMRPTRARRSKVAPGRGPDAWLAVSDHLAEALERHALHRRRGIRREVGAGLILRGFLCDRQPAQAADRLPRRAAPRRAASRPRWDMVKLRAKVCATPEGCAVTGRCTAERNGNGRIGRPSPSPVIVYSSAPGAARHEPVCSTIVP